MLLQRKNDSREASSTSLTGCAAPARTPAAIALDAIEERRAGEDARHTGADSGVEGAVAFARLLVERHRRFDIGRVDRTAIRASREVGEDLLGASGLVSR